MESFECGRVQRSHHKECPIASLCDVPFAFQRWLPAQCERSYLLLVCDRPLLRFRRIDHPLAHETSRHPADNTSLRRRHEFPFLWLKFLSSRLRVFHLQRRPPSCPSNFDNRLSEKTRLLGKRIASVDRCTSRAILPPIAFRWRRRRFHPDSRPGPLDSTMKQTKKKGAFFFCPYNFSHLTNKGSCIDHTHRSGAHKGIPNSFSR